MNSTACWILTVGLLVAVAANSIYEEELADEDNFAVEERKGKLCEYTAC